MIAFDETALFALFSQFRQFVICYPIFSLSLLLAAYFLFKLLTLREIVADYPNQVPPQVRQVAGQQAQPSYPNGWIPILESRAISLNQVKSVLVFGIELAVIRVSTGAVYVIDAFCPHLGANLAIGGTVHRNDCNEECIRCPFHGWSFRMSDGQCDKVPYEDAPVNAKVNHWPVKEMNGAIFVWYHEHNQAPNWEPAVVEEIANGQWVYQGRTEHTVNCHIQEIPENGADIAHFGEIHVDGFLFGSNLNLLNKLKHLRFFRHEMEVRWSPCPPPQQHTAYTEMLLRNTFFGFTLFTVNIRTTQIGPAYAEFRLQVPLLGGLKGIILQYFKPISPMRTSFTSQVYTEKSPLGFIFAKILLTVETKMLERDFMIWNRKAYLAKPHLSKTEKSLIKYRRWYSQFYTQKSIDW